MFLSGREHTGDWKQDFLTLSPGSTAEMQGSRHAGVNCPVAEMKSDLGKKEFVLFWGEGREERAARAER